MSTHGLPVPAGLQRDGYKDRDEWLASARFTLDLMAQTIARADLRDVDVLDIGCGTKLVKILSDEHRPIGRYVGVDVASEVIDWLHEHVNGQRFEFHKLTARNSLYNPDGIPLSEIEHLPFSDRTFDLITLFSVFTHLDPGDYVAMLRLLARYASPDSKLLFSVYLRDTRALERALEAGLASDDPERVAQTRAAIGATQQQRASRFIDALPDRPLLRATYDRDYALELVQGTGWAVESLNAAIPPHIQHYVICTPI